MGIGDEIDRSRRAEVSNRGQAYVPLAYDLTMRGFFASQDWRVEGFTPTPCVGVYLYYQERRGRTTVEPVYDRCDP